MLSNTIHIIMIVAIFQSVFIFLSLILKKGRNNPENILIFLVTFFFSLQIIMQIAMYNKSVFSFVTFFKEYYLFYQTAFILAPIIYLLIKSTIEVNFSFSNSVIKHFIPFILVSGIVVILSYGLKIRLYFYYVRPLIIAQGFLYITLSIRYLKNNNITINPFKTPVNIQSLGKCFLFFFIILWIANVQQYLIVNIFNIPHRCFCEISIYSILLFLVINSLGFIAIARPNALAINRKYSSNPISEKEKEKLIKSIHEFISEATHYKNPDLSIQDVGDGLGVSSRLISQVINEAYNTNFKDFLNKFRVKHAQKMLSEIIHSNLTIQEILYSSGFNSKSNFNLVFKKYADCTPLEYRRKHLS